jgi:uncharacterized membrane protein (UPF0127 family)
VTSRAAALLLVASLVACTMRAGAPSTRPDPKLVVAAAGAPRPETTLPVVFAEVADTPERRQRGLGGRTKLEPDHGMLFVYEFDMAHQFWMKDCLIALDIAFIDSRGRIVNVVTMQPPAPGVPDARLPHAVAAADSQYVLETTDGWFARHGLGAGDLVDLSAALPKR